MLQEKSLFDTLEHPFRRGKSVVAWCVSVVLLVTVMTVGSVASGAAPAHAHEPQDCSKIDGADEKYRCEYTKGLGHAAYKGVKTGPYPLEFGDKKKTTQGTRYTTLGGSTLKSYDRLKSPFNPNGYLCSARSLQGGGDQSISCDATRFRREVVFMSKGQTLELIRKRNNIRTMLVALAGVAAPIGLEGIKYVFADTYLGKAADLILKARDVTIALSVVGGDQAVQYLSKDVHLDQVGRGLCYYSVMVFDEDGVAYQESQDTYKYHRIGEERDPNYPVIFTPDRKQDYEALSAVGWYSPEYNDACK